MTRRIWLIVALLAGVLVAGGLMLFSRLEHYEEVIDKGPSPQARSNPWLAAEDFLRQRTIPVTVAETATRLPDPAQGSQTLLWLDSREYMTPAEADRVLRWARAGGHLLFVAEQLWDEKSGRSGDLLLDRLQLQQWLSKDLRKDDAAAVNAMIPFRVPMGEAATTSWPELTRLYLENENAPAYMSFDTRFHLDDPQDLAQSWANSADATHMLQLPYGEGLITVLTDADLWKTQAIGRYDNAWLLWYLTQDSSVTMVVRTFHDTLARLILRHFPLLLVTLTLLLVLALWRASLRSGPLRAPVATARRQLGEHLRASARFMRRRHGEQSLLRALQADILNRARVRHPGFENLVVTEQWQVLARLTRQSTSLISQALRPRPAQRLSAAEFIRQVADLQTIRNAL
jgi:hypothetical protein